VVVGSKKSGALPPSQKEGVNLLGGVKLGVAKNTYSDAEHWINGFDSRFDEAFKKFEHLQEHY
jgi:hypothetical protein